MKGLDTATKAQNPGKAATGQQAEQKQDADDTDSEMHSLTKSTLEQI